MKARSGDCWATEDEVVDLGLDACEWMHVTRCALWNVLQQQVRWPCHLLPLADPGGACSTQAVVDMATRTLKLCSHEDLAGPVWRCGTSTASSVMSLMLIGVCVCVCHTCHRCADACGLLMKLSASIEICQEHHFSSPCRKLGRKGKDTSSSLAPPHSRCSARRQL